MTGCWRRDSLPLLRWSLSLTKPLSEEESVGDEWRMQGRVEE